jgi:hypothetical protein
LTFNFDQKKADEEKKAVDLVIMEAVEKERELIKLKVAKEHKRKYRNKT